MTREEAIEIVKSAFSAWESEFRVPNDDWSEEHEALDMAIEALQTPPISQRSMYQLGYIQGQEDALQTDIVRCEECEHKADNYCYKHSHEVTDSDFCSYGERSEELMNELLKAYELIKQYMDRLDIGIQTAWIYLEDAYRKAQEGEEE